MSALGGTFAWLPIEELIAKRQQEYYRALQLADASNDSSCFVIMILHVIRDVLQEMPLADRPSTDQAPTKLNVSEQRAVSTLISALGNDTLSAAELMGRMGLTHRPHFRKIYLTPALQSGLLERTIPDKPNSPHQRYRAAREGR